MPRRDQRNSSVGLDIDLPRRLQSLTFGHAFNQRLEEVGVLPVPFFLVCRLCKKLHNFRVNKMQVLHEIGAEWYAQVSLPSSLHSLTFGFSFNESLERVPLPPNLRSLTFGNKFNRSLEEANPGKDCILHGWIHRLIKDISGHRKPCQLV